MALKLQGEIGLDGSGFYRELESVEEGLTSFKGIIMESFAVGAIVEATRAAMEFGEAVKNGSERLGVSTQEYQKLQAAAIGTGVDMEQLSGSFDRLAKSKEQALGYVGSGSDAEMDKARKSFENLGLSIDEIKDKTPQQIFEEIGESVKRLGVNSQTTADLMMIFGRSAGKLIPLLKEISEQKPNLTFVSDEDIKALDEASKKSKSVWNDLKNVGASVVAKALHPIDALAEFEAGGKTSGKGVRELTDELNIQKSTAEFVARGMKEEKDVPDFRIKPKTKAEEKESVEVLKIEEQITTEKKSGELAAMTSDQKRIELEKRIKDLEHDIAGAPFEGLSEKETASKKLELVKTENQLSAINKVPAPTRMRSADSLVSVGNFLGSGANSTIVDIAKKQHEELKKHTTHLNNIEKALSKSGDALGVPTTS